ncbi:MAG: hypothetical protein IPP34_13825 [Bacteroidetes bacterium]|nr:hypothetical protein [Bacteroidota bacterium]
MKEPSNFFSTLLLFLKAGYARKFYNKIKQILQDKEQDSYCLKYISGSFVN